MLAVARSTGDREGEADAMMRGASSRLRRHDIASAPADFEAAREVYERIGQAYRTSEVAVNLATVYGFAGDWEAALEVSRSAMKQLASLGELRRRSAAAHNVVNCLIELGRYAEAADAVPEALELARAAESTVMEAYVIGLRGTIAREVGDYAAARRDLEQCVAMERAMPTGYERASNLVELALTLVEAGALDDAATVLAELDALPAQETATMMWPQFVPYVLHRYLGTRGDIEGAARELARADELLREQRERLPDETWRRRFNASLVNRRIRAAAAAANAGHPSAV
jgi:tetratricopeptide (TPR) repeat protein